MLTTSCGHEQTVCGHVNVTRLLKTLEGTELQRVRRRRNDAPDPPPLMIAVLALAIRSITLLDDRADNFPRHHVVLIQSHSLYSTLLLNCCTHPSRVHGGLVCGLSRGDVWHFTWL